MRRRRWILLLVLGAAGCSSKPSSPLARAANYLWHQQTPDGGWHSKTYGLLRSGQALTPFVLDALLQVPEEVYKPPGQESIARLPLSRATHDRTAPWGCPRRAFLTTPTTPLPSQSVRCRGLNTMAGKRKSLAWWATSARSNSRKRTGGIPKIRSTARGGWAVKKELRRKPDMWISQ